MITFSRYSVPLPDTPKIIKEKYKDDEDNPLDVFEITLGKLTIDGFSDAIDVIIDMCWRRFRNRPIGDYDYKYWLEALDDKVNYIWPVYSKLFKKCLESDIVAIYTGKDEITENAINTKAAVTTQDLTVTNNLTESTENNQVMNETTIVESEDNPDVAAGSTKYLSNRSNTERNTETDINATTNNTGTIKNTGTINNDDETINERTSRIERQDGMNAENLVRVGDALKEIVEKFMLELEPLFLNRW